MRPTSIHLLFVACLLIVQLAVGLRPAAAQLSTETLLFSFIEGNNVPAAHGMIQGSDGNFYGTTPKVFFRMTPAGVVTVLHTFQDGSVTNDGSGPNANLVQGTDGNFYGTTTFGGSTGFGTVFKMTPTGQETILHSFLSAGSVKDGSNPYAGLVQGVDGNFYGTTSGDNNFGGGTVFQITPVGVETVLHYFGSIDGDGLYPYAGLVQGNDGNFYGVTTLGGPDVSGGGIVYKISSAGVYSIVYSFGFGAEIFDGASPYATLIKDVDGNLYGTTSQGGAGGFGTVFRMTPAGVETILHSFGDGTVFNDGQNPFTSLVQDANGNFYGTTSAGGSGAFFQNGTAYQVTPTGQTTILRSFNDGTITKDGYNPSSPLILATDGSFYGTTMSGGTNGDGIIYKLALQTGLEADFTGVLFNGWYQSPLTVFLSATQSTGATAGLRYAIDSGATQTYSTSFQITDQGSHTLSYNSVDGVGGTINTGSKSFKIDTVPPVSTAQITGTQSGGIYTHNVSITLSASDATSGISHTYYLIDASGDQRTYTGPFTIASPGDHILYYWSVDNAGNFEIQHTAEFIINSGAAFVGVDPLTQGNWKDSYGAEGYNVIGDTSANNPHYVAGVSTTPGTHNSGVWAASSLSPSSLQTVSPGSPNRLAGVWYQTSWTMNVNTSGTHQLALYLLDYTNAGYAETITFKDGVSGSVISTQTASNFGGGVYYIWNVTGNVNVTLTSTSTSGHWAVISGIFFGGGASTSPSQPTDLIASPIGNGVGLTWTPSTGAISYDIYRGTTAGGESTTPIATGITSTTYSDVGLPANTTYYYKIVAVNSNAGSFASDEAFGTTLTSTAAFVTTDTTTQGNWKDNYGVDGYNVIGDTGGANPNYPAYAVVTPGSHNSGVWATSSLSPACLQTTVPGSTTRLAGVWYQTSWTITVSVTGTHQLALYLLDQPNSGYAETISIKDAVTGLVLDTRSASTFAGGVYLVWSVTGSVKVTLTSTAGHWAVISGIFFGGPPALKSPTRPTGLVATPTSAAIGLTWTASTGATSYNIYRGTTSGGESTTPIATGITSTSFTNIGLAPNSTYAYQVVAANATGGSFASTEATATVPAATAAFVKTDSTTHGSWKGVYGADGFNVIGDVSTGNPTYPGYATVTPGAHNSGVWAASSTAANCLQKVAAGSTSRIAGVWYQTSWSMNVNVTGTHQLALYLLDFPNAGYAETITIKDAASGAVLDTRSASSFTGGVYEVWNVNGNVNVTLTSTAGHWAVLSGIFFR